MLRSTPHHKPADPPNPPPDPPPGPDDRYAPVNCLRLDMVDIHGQPVVAVLTRRAAACLADQLFQHLHPETSMEVPQS